jgi:hypothetical protein
MGNKTLLMYGGLFVLPRSTDKFDNTPLIEAIDRLCHICNHRHIKLESQARIEFVLPRLNADKAGKLIGIVLAEYETGDLFRGEPEGSEIYDILDFRQLRGITQALVDWEVVRLVASTLGIDLGSGQLFVIDTND